MRWIRRLLQVVALVGTLLVGIMATALIVSQTPWFRDWLRRYIVRESKQYLNGQLAIGGLGGNLLFGVNLSDVSVDVSGERVIAVKALSLDYSVFELISSGLALNEIKLDQPVIRLERNAQGWNVARLIKKQEKEADREGPGRPLSLPLIQISDAHITVDDPVGTSGVRVPEQIADLDVKAAFEYEPVHYSLTLDHVSFRGRQPQLAMNQLAGKIAVRDDNLYVEQLVIKTAETSVTIDGVIEQYLRTPVVRVTTTGTVSMPEIGRVVPAFAPYRLHPAFDLKATGPAERLSLDVDVRSEAGNVRGSVTADAKGPDFGVEGDLYVERLNLAPIVRNPRQKSDLTGRARLDLEIAARPANAPVSERMSGSFSFEGPRVVAAGYEARDVKVSGEIDGPRIALDGRATAYRGTATARGFIVVPSEGRPLRFDLRGQANGVDLRDLPASMGAPALATNLSVAEYQVRGEGRSISGSAELNRSTVEGATLADGTTAQFALTPREISYAAKASVTGLNLQRIGRGLKVAALARPEYDSRITGTFDVSGRMPRTDGERPAGSSALSTMTVDATGAIRDSELMGGRLPALSFEAHVDQGAFSGRANGEFQGFDPARISGRTNLAGAVSGSVDANVQIADLAAPVTPEAVTADGKVTLSQSTVGGLEIDSADLQGRYASQVGDITRVNVTGPDLKVDASGRLALDRATQSNLKYHVEAVNLARLAQLAGQKGVDGAAILDGTMTGNAASLTTTGTLDGSNLRYQENSALDLDARYTVTVPDMKFAEARVQSTTDATFVKAGGFDISMLTATTTYEANRIEFSTNIKEKTRELDASGSVVLHPDHQEIHLPQLALRTQGVEWRSAAGSEAAIQYGQGRIELKDVKLVSADQALDVSGTITTGENAPPTSALEVKAQNVDLQQLETLLLQDRGFTGRLSADARVTGSTANPTVDGHVEIHNGGFKTYKYESLVADVDYTARRVELDAILRQSPTEQITAKGTVPMSLFERSPKGGHVPPGAGDAVDLQIKSTALGLGVVQGFTDIITNVTGTMEADVRVTGSGQDPHLAGFVDIKNGGFGVPLGGTSYTGLDTRIELSTDTVRLQKFDILDEEGERLSVSGELAVHEKQLGAVNVSITSDNFELIDNELGDVGVDTTLKITGELRRPRVEGAVKLEAGRLEVDRLLQVFYDPYSVQALPEVVSAERTVEGAGSAEDATKAALSRAHVSAAPPGAESTPSPETAAPGGIMQALTLDVTARIPDNLVLRGDDLRPGGPTGAALGDMNLTVGGDMRIRKDPGGPIVLVGTINTVRGTYEFQGRRFELVRGGTLRFVGTPQINPLLDISATRVIPNTGVEARVRITGSAKAPELALSSNPPLEESDILALIVFNRPVNELGTGERSSLAATAGGIATGFIAAPLGESIGKALDLDLFEITTTTEEGDLGAGLTLGQQIADKAFVKMRQQFGDRSYSEFMIEYQLADFLRLQATAAPETQGSANRLNQRRIERAGIDLIFFFSY